MLPHGTILCDLDLSGDGTGADSELCALVSMDDVVDYYYNFLVSEDRSLSNAMIGEYPLSQFVGTHAHAVLTERYGPLPASTAVVGCLHTMAQGDHQAVEVGQEAHFNIAWEAGGLTAANVMIYRAPPPRGPYWGGCYY